MSLTVGAVQAAIAQRAAKPATTTTGWHGWPADAPPPAIAPFDAELAKKHQQDWAAYLKVPVEYTKSIGMMFILIPPGEFTMGSTPAEIEEALRFVGENKHWQECHKSEGPQHKVILTQPIYLGINEVTQADYENVMGKNPPTSAPDGCGKSGCVARLDTSTHPVEMVSSNDAAEFCAKLSQQEKLKPFYSRAGETVTPLDGTGYRLPTEAEWEFACRAGTTTRYWTGDKDEDLPQTGWFVANSDRRTHAVGELKANPFGLHDIHGNIWEWVQDGWEPTYYGQFQEKPALDPSGPLSAGSRRCISGAALGHDPASTCRASIRNAGPPTYRDFRIGFRVSLMVGAVKKGEATKPVTTLNDPAFQKWMKLVAGMTAEKQVEAVARKLQELNPGFDGKMTEIGGGHTPRIENGVVTGIGLVTDHVTDISPVRALAGLSGLNCYPANLPNGKLADLSPLRGLQLVMLSCVGNRIHDLSPITGMKLVELNCGGNPIADISALQGMPLRSLNVGSTDVSDLSPLKGMPLKGLSFDSTKVTTLSSLEGMALRHLFIQATSITDLSPLKGMPLEILNCSRTQVSDLSPLKGMPLKELWLDFKPEQDTEFLRSIETLQTINGKPAAEFWKQFEASLTFLADLSPVWKSHEPGCFSTDGTILGHNYQVQGKESPNGIFLHPPVEGFSEIAYTLNRAFEKFESGVAIPGTGRGAGSALTFEVIGDDTVLWTSKPIQEFDQPQSCKVNVKNVNTLTLRVHCPGSNGSAHAVWLEPRLFPSASAPAIGLQPPKWDVERSAAEWVLSLGGTVGIRIDRQEREIGEGGTLPAGNFVLERIDLRNKPITAADLARLKGLSSLHRTFPHQLPYGRCRPGALEKPGRSVGAVCLVSRNLRCRAGAPESLDQSQIAQPGRQSRCDRCRLAASDAVKKAPAS